MGSLAAATSSKAMAPDDGALSTGGRDDAVRIWKTSTAEHPTIFASSLGPIRAPAFSRDGGTIAAAEGETVLHQDTATRRVRSTLRGRDGIVLALSFSPDGRSPRSEGIGPPRSRPSRAVNYV
jgi:WD40 repeat protein